MAVGVGLREKLAGEGTGDGGTVRRIWGMGWKVG